MNAANRLIVLLASDTPSFCYYEPKVSPVSKVMPFAVLASVVEFAEANGMLLNLVYGKAELPPKHRQLIKSLPHATIRPWSNGFQPSANEDALLVLDNPTVAQARAVRGNGEMKCVLRVKRSRLAHLAQACSVLAHKFKRINLVLLDIPQYTPADYELYRQQLEALRAVYESELRTGGGKEFSALTDRLLLTQMRDCDAGLGHVTCGPNGKLYVCPGFYFDDEKDVVGDLESGVHLVNGRLLEQANAPLCATCDAFHCKRCVYLNKRTTLEVNTPSKEQCVLSHIERNVSRNLGEELRAAGHLGLQSIPELDYLDPFEVVQRENHESRDADVETARADAGLDTLEGVLFEPGQADIPFAQLHEKELLVRILNTQVDIQKRLESIEQVLSRRFSRKTTMSKDTGGDNGPHTNR